MLTKIGNGILDNIQSEPLVWIALIDALVSLAVILGLPVPDAAKLGIDAVLQPIAVIVARSAVTPNAKLPNTPAA